MLLSRFVRLALSTCVSLLFLYCFYEQINRLMDWILSNCLRVCLFVCLSNCVIVCASHVVYKFCIC